MAHLDLPPVDAAIAYCGYRRPEVPIHVRWCSWDDWFAYCWPQAQPCADHRTTPMPGLVRDNERDPSRGFDYNIDHTAARYLADHSPC